MRPRRATLTPHNLGNIRAEAISTAAPISTLWQWQACLFLSLSRIEYLSVLLIWSLSHTRVHISHRIWLHYRDKPERRHDIERFECGQPTVTRYEGYMLACSSRRLLNSASLPLPSSMLAIGTAHRATRHGTYYLADGDVVVRVRRFL